MTPRRGVQPVEVMQARSAAPGAGALGQTAASRSDSLRAADTLSAEFRQSSDRLKEEMSALRMSLQQLQAAPAQVLSYEQHELPGAADSSLDTLIQSLAAKYLATSGAAPAATVASQLHTAASRATLDATPKRDGISRLSPEPDTQRGAGTRLVGGELEVRDGSSAGDAAQTTGLAAERAALTQRSRQLEQALQARFFCTLLGLTVR